LVHIKYGSSYLIAELDISMTYFSACTDYNMRFKQKTRESWPPLTICAIVAKCTLILISAQRSGKCVKCSASDQTLFCPGSLCFLWAKFSPKYKHKSCPSAGEVAKERSCWWTTSAFKC